MWKRILSLVTCAAILCCCPIAYATEMRTAQEKATLDFNNNTAICISSCSSQGKTIVIKMELWQGSTLLKTWSKTGVHVVSMKESYSVTPGKSYTLKVSGTCGGVAFSPTWIMKTCPIN